MSLQGNVKEKATCILEAGSEWLGVDDFDEMWWRCLVPHAKKNTAMTLRSNAAIFNGTGDILCSSAISDATMCRLTEVAVEFETKSGLAVDLALYLPTKT